MGYYPHPHNEKRDLFPTDWYLSSQAGFPAAKQKRGFPLSPASLYGLFGVVILQYFPVEPFDKCPDMVFEKIDLLLVLFR